jgi:acyl dehydratase
MYFDDFTVGNKYTTGGRTITETDLILYSGISGVYSPLHLDEEYCKNTIFKKRIAHGPLILSISNGLVGMLNLCEDSVVALMEMEWKFLKPVFIGDTIRVTETVHSKKNTRNAERGIVIFSRSIQNQNQEEVQKGIIVVLIKKKQPQCNEASD